MFRIFGVRGRRTMTIVGASAAMAFPLASIGAGAANAATVHGASWMAHASAATVHSDGSATCGTPNSAPSFLPPGTYTSLTVAGICGVDGGPVTVTGNVTIEGTGALATLWHSSPFTADGSMAIEPGGAALLGCGPASACMDDPNASTHPTLVSTTTIGGSLHAQSPLGVIIHNSHIAGDAIETGGGGGVNCNNPVGIFAIAGGAPFSDYEDSTIGGNLAVTGVRTCWYGTFRNRIGGSVTLMNNHTFAPPSAGDPDGNEVVTNVIGGNLICENNLPAIQFGDSAEETSNHPDIVSGDAVGQCSFSTKMPNPAAAPPSMFGPGNPAGTPENISVPSAVETGYTMVSSDGGAFPLNAAFHGSAVGGAAQPFVGIATTPGGGGYWISNFLGSVAFGGNALLGFPFPPTRGSIPTINAPMTGIAAAPGGDGFWTVASDGGVFQSGSGAGFFGSLGATHLNKPIVAMAAAPDGQGYYLVGSDGGVFPFGSGSKYAGSLGNIHLNAAIVGIAADPATGGYWLVGADGGVFPFNAPYLGSLGSIHLNASIVGIVAAPTGNGYYLVAADGGVFPFGPGAHYQGSLGSVKLNAPIVGMGLG